MDTTYQQHFSFTYSSNKTAEASTWIGILDEGKFLLIVRISIGFWHTVRHWHTSGTLPYHTFTFTFISRTLTRYVSRSNSVDLSISTDPVFKKDPRFVKIDQLKGSRIWISPRTSRVKETLARSSLSYFRTPWQKSTSCSLLSCECVVINLY